MQKIGSFLAFLLQPCVSGGSEAREGEPNQAISAAQILKSVSWEDKLAISCLPSHISVFPS